MKPLSEHQVLIDDYTELLGNQERNQKTQQNVKNTLSHHRKRSIVQSWLVDTEKPRYMRKTQNISLQPTPTINEQNHQHPTKQLFLEPTSIQQNVNNESNPPQDIPVELETSLDDIFSMDSVYFFCPFCRSASPGDDHIKKDIRKRKHKPETQRWACKKYKRKFTNDRSPFNYPLWVCYFSCHNLAAGMELEATKKNLELLAKEKGASLSITTSAIRRLLENIIWYLDEFERGIKHPIESEAWEIDEMWQPISKQHSKRRRAWIITVTADNSRYLLATHVCSRRSYKNSLKALQTARSRAKSDPNIVKCDGLRSHEKAAKKLFPNATVIAVKKKVHFGHISHIERIHKTTRLGALRKRRRFYSMKTLEIFVELDRIDYNFIRTNDSPGETSSYKAGIDLSIHDWRDLLLCALRFHLRKRLIEAYPN